MTMERMDCRGKLFCLKIWTIKKPALYLCHSAADVGGLLNHNEMKKKLQLEVGKYYRSREGEVVRIVKNHGTNKYPCQGNNIKWYAEDGRYDLFPELPEDLIEEVTDPILQFFTYPRAELLSISAIETAAGMPSRTLYKFLKGTRGLPKKHRAPLIEILKTLGYDG